MGALKMRPGNGFQTVGSNTSILVLVQDRKPKRRSSKPSQPFSPNARRHVFSTCNPAHLWSISSPEPS